MVWAIVFALFCHAIHSLADDSVSVVQSSGVSSSESSERLQVTMPGLPNAKRLCDQVWAGDQPKNQLAFDQLAKQGIRVIISVDGAAPEIEQAKRAGLRYVHLPIGYDGIDESRSTELAAALVQLSGPFYVHCHHGQHRAPAAASVACIRTGWISARQGQAFLTLCGTSPQYKGLYRSVHDAKPDRHNRLAGLDLDFPAVTQTSDLVQRMGQIDKTFEKLQRGWNQPVKKTPAADLGHLRLLLDEQFTELSRAHRRDSFVPSEQRLPFAKELQATGNLIDSLQHQRDQPEAARATLRSIRSACQRCHHALRD